MVPARRRAGRARRPFPKAHTRGGPARGALVREPGCSGSDRRSGRWPGTAEPPDARGIRFRERPGRYGACGVAARGPSGAFPGGFRGPSGIRSAWIRAGGRIRAPERAGAGVVPRLRIPSAGCCTRAGRAAARTSAGDPGLWPDMVPGTGDSGCICSRDPAVAVPDRAADRPGRCRREAFLTCGAGFRAEDGRCL